MRMYAVQIRAQGYLPIMSQMLYIGAGNQDLEFRLQKGTGPGGVLLLPDGRPAPDVKVRLFGLEGSVYMDQPAEARERATDGFEAITDAQGRFQFKPRIGDHSVIVVHAAGYAEVPVEELARKREIKLTPYGRVEGRLLVHGKPAADEDIYLRSVHFRYRQNRYRQNKRMFPALSLWLKVKTDSQGRFIFPKVPPGLRKLEHRLNLGKNDIGGSTALSHGKPIQVAGG